MSADDMTANGVSASDISSSEIAANAITTSDLVNEVGAIASQSPNDIFTAERIVKQRMYCKKKQYFIKWKDYPESDNSWEPAENIFDDILIKNFKKEQSALKSESSAGSVVSKKKKSSKRNFSTLEIEPQEASKSLELDKSNVQASTQKTASKDTTSDMDATKKKKNKSSSKRNSSTLEKQLSQRDSKPSKKVKLSNSFAQTPKEKQPILKSDSESSGYSTSQTPIIETNDNQNNAFGGNSMSSPSVFAHKSPPNSYGTVEPILNGGSELPTYPVITSNGPTPVASASATSNLMNDSVLSQYADNVGANNVQHNNNCNLPAYFTHAQKDNISFSLTINGITRTCSFQTLWSTNQSQKEVSKPSFNLPS